MGVRVSVLLQRSPKLGARGGQGLATVFDSPFLTFRFVISRSVASGSDLSRLIRNLSTLDTPLSVGKQVGFTYTVYSTAESHIIIDQHTHVYVDF